MMMINKYLCQELPMKAKARNECIAFSGGEDLFELPIDAKTIEYRMVFSVVQRIYLIKKTIDISFTLKRKHEMQL